MSKLAAIYARVSSDRQKEDKTIASQTSSLREYAQTQGYTVPPDWVFEDEGYSGATLARPGLERLRDLVSAGATLVMMPAICSWRARRDAFSLPAFGSEQKPALVM